MIALFSLGCVAWAIYFAVFLLVRARVPVLEQLAPKPLSDWPTLSLVVAARNEAVHLEAALATKLSQDYPSLELVVVDDRSTDQTGRLLDEAAARDSRIVAIHVTELPEGWLGKLHAMHRGVAASHGEWILLSDADVHLSPGTLKKVIAWAENEKLDHVAAVPSVWPTNVFLDAVLSTGARQLHACWRGWAVQDPRSTASAGCGAFNLMRRSAYDKTPGFEWLKMEIGDDVALGQMLKANGARSALLNARNVMGLQFYASVPDMARHMEKTAGAGGMRPFVLIAASLFAWVVECAPFLVAVWPGVPMPLRAAAIALSLFAMLLSAAMNRWGGQPFFPALLVPVGATIGSAIMIRASLLYAVRGGVHWRGTFYRRDDLRRGARFQFWPSSTAAAVPARPADSQ